MELINLNNPPKFHQADLDLVFEALAGRFKCSVMPHYVFGDIYTKYDKYTGIAEPKEKTQVFKPDRRSRLNWGALYRACKRLYHCAVISSFTLRHNGKLTVSFVFNKSKKKITNNEYKKPYNPEYLFPSIVNPQEIKEDKRKENCINVYKPNTAPKFKPYDYALSRVEVEERLLKDRYYIHSAEAIQSRKRAYGSESSACNTWGEKFKLNPDYFTNTVRHIDSETVYNKQCMDRGYCVYPKP